MSNGPDYDILIVNIRNADGSTVKNRISVFDGAFLRSWKGCDHAVAVRIVLAVEDQQYVEALLDFVRSSEFNRRIQITAFSKPEAFLKHVSSGANPADVVAAEMSFLSPWMASGDGNKGLPWVCLSESGKEAVEGPVQRKYQPLPELLEGLLEHALAPEAAVRSGKASEAPVIGVYSAAGGCGKTTVAMHLAKQLGTEGAKVFYLNLETFRKPYPLAGGNGEDGFAKLLYDIKAAMERNKLPDAPVAHYAVRHSLIQADMFLPVSNVRELLEMDKQDTTRLIDYIAASGGYDLIVAETDPYPDGRSEGVLERCDKLVWLLTDDEDALDKSAAFLEFLEKSAPAFYSVLMKKTVFVSNRYSGSLMCPVPRPEMAPALTLSYIPEWKQAGRARMLSDTPLFRRDMLKLCRHLFAESGRLARSV
ncbi:hypothetical protein [Paenibacillus caui]|uniref:hypothetical protein n=1 Tax=Paenibacillus caui TaxID=2873927 RepID=UPI001CA9DBCE|nr:hypothetical protein [Paenibacillus caui]